MGIILDANKMPMLCGISFGYDLKRDDYLTDAPLHSLEAMVSETNANTVIFAFHAMQDDAQSTQIDYQGEETPTKEGLKRVVDKARELGLYVILKPMLDCRNGTWRAHINFFDHDVPCEPKWSEWFTSYTEYQVHFAKIAQELNVDMVCIACEMVQTQRREQDWRNCINEIRKYYDGPLTWNCDKYQEEHVPFWDALDVISASGYYPIDNWDMQLSRIEQVVQKYQKPFFFIECGCMTCKSSPMVPNNWMRFENELKQAAKEANIEYDRNAFQINNLSDSVHKDILKSVVDFDSQSSFYETVLSTCEKYSFVRGFGLWDWEGKLQFDENTVKYDGGYGIHLKQSANVVNRYYTKWRKMY
ncbi:1,4-beta-xylanase [Paludicola sp. MB14-C6]|uniref:glycoside hydrolase family 113 n=1 Tax=Paludihabitans sp. MB14-C6 TaxID=3070656 RepID=UPI0027DCFF63|nr:1,4-beta-xylanase [Paludicola sp. MB14-C6]WMJ23968.1 1,4-beta-xylanase [Paludicola sp. MB14-C6]